ncbi:M14 family metallopeptidase [Chitinophaga lutea]
MRLLSILILLSFSLRTAYAQTSPGDFLQYPLGSRFTPYFKVMDYFEHIAATAKTVKLETYGATYEGRPLVMAIVASPENMARLENIRQQNVAMLKGQEAAGQPVIIWLSYNVHGNEAVSTEAAMKTLYTLVTSRSELLRNAIVIIDPCLNPDGRERYVNFYNALHSKIPDATPYAREHYEPWPGGRSNHYYFDLNRDWAWQTQVESRQRLLQYNRWMPQVHVDFHEQGVDAPYYFAPAAEPLHDAVTPWQREFQTQIGRHNASYFDAKGWLYFTREQFDLFYPSYGDTYPTYNGAIGMTYEQGGSGRAGLAIETRQGDTLTLKDRIEHHFTTGMATIEISATNAGKLVSEFHRYFRDAQNAPAGDYKTFVVKAAGNPEKLQALAELLKKNEIEAGFATGNGSGGSGFNYFTGKTESFQVEKGDLVVSAFQPRSNLVRVLFEPVARLTDSVTYDITAWALPYAYGLPAYAVKQRLAPSVQPTPEKPAVAPAAAGNTYAYLAPWNSAKDLKFLAALLHHNYRVRFSETAFTIGQQSFPAGTLVITRAGNKSLDGIPDLAQKMEIALVKVPTGFVDKGFDFGSDKMRFIRKPKVGIVAGDGVSSLGMGEIWHFFEQQLEYPLTVVNAAQLGGASWHDLDVLILPDGRYPALNDKAGAERLREWVKAGGKLIALEDAAAQLGEGDWGFKIKKDTTGDKTKKAPYDALKAYANRERESVTQFIPGAIYKVHLDKTHPLAFGYPEYYYTLKLNDHLVEYIEDGGWNVGALRNADYLTGFVGAQTKQKLRDGTVFGVKEMGSGSVVLLTDDPLFRSFWENGKLLFGNAVFLVGQ